MSPPIDSIVAWGRRTEVQPGLPAAPSERVAIVTCMDARILPEKHLGISVGDVHLIRNAGAVVTEDVIRSLMLSQHLLGTTSVMVIGHTRCGMDGLDEEQVADAIEEARGARPGFPLRSFTRVRDSVAGSLRQLQESPLVIGEIRGFVFDVDTGALDEVTDSGSGSPVLPS